MTVYTDAVTGKKYDRLPGGAKNECGYITPYVPCGQCALHQDKDACSRAVPLCAIQAQTKAVFFIFKERKA